jgi:hypothetical protein
MVEYQRGRDATPSRDAIPPVVNRQGGGVAEAGPDGTKLLLIMEQGRRAGCNKLQP